ncbi:MAG: hypothetical protein K6A68_02330, partial [Clostridiales bacterium]|nr:hypothetical protein [Clostridiales bacterium]
MRRLFLFLVFCLLFPLMSAHAETAWVSSHAVYPAGSSLTLSFVTDQPSVTIYLTDADGKAIQVLPSTVTDGNGSVVLPDLSLPKGDYHLFLIAGSESFPLSLSITDPLPEILSVDAPLEYDSYWSAYVHVNAAGTLVATLPGGNEAARMDVQPGSNRMTLSGSLPSG